MREENVNEKEKREEVAEEEEEEEKEGVKGSSNDQKRDKTVTGRLKRGKMGEWMRGRRRRGGHYRR